MCFTPRRPRQSQISADRRPPTRGRQIERLRDLARGPGKLTAALRVDRWLDGVDLCRERLLWLGRGDDNPDGIGQSIRIGIARDAKQLLRFIFGAAPLRQRSKIAQGIRGRTTTISSPPDKGARIRSPLIPLAVTSHCMNSSAAYEYAEPSGVTPSVFGSPSRSPKSKTRARGQVVEKVWKCSGNCTSSTGRATGDAHELSQRLDDASSRLHSLRGAPRYRLPETLEGAIIAQQRGPSGAER